MVVVGKEIDTLTKERKYNTCVEQFLFKGSIKAMLEFC